MHTGIGIGLSLSYGGKAGFSPGSFPGAKAFYLLNEGSGSILKNSLDSTVPDSNIWYAPESITSKYTQTQGAGITVTGGQTGVNGNPTATRVTCTATGATKYAQTTNFTLPAGTYTIKLQAKSFDGSAYTFRFVDVTHVVYSSDQTVSAAWQPFSYTFTIATVCNAFGYLAIGSALAASDILVDQIQIVSGGSAPTYNGTGLHARLVPTGTQSWTARGISIPTSTSTLAVAIKAASTSVVKYTAYGAFKISSEGIPQFNGLIGHDDITLNTYLKQWLCSSGNVAQMYANSQPLTTRLQQPTDGQWHVLASQMNGAGGVLKLYLDGILIECLKNDGGTYTSTVLSLFSLPGGITDCTVGEVGCIGWYEDTHTDAQVKQISNGIKAMVAARGATFAVWNNVVVYEGDSLNVNPTPATCFPGLIKPNLPANTATVLAAQSGSYLSAAAYGTSPQLRASDVILSLNSVTGKKVLMLKCGTNDIAVNNFATITANFTTYINTILAGCPTARIGIDTIMKRGDRPDLDVLVGQLNTWIRANAGTLFYGTPDTQSDARLQDPTNATYFQGDQIHWTAAGQTVAAGIIQTWILATLAA